MKAKKRGHKRLKKAWKDFNRVAKRLKHLAGSSTPKRFEQLLKSAQDAEKALEREQETLKKVFAREYKR